MHKRMNNTRLDHFFKCIDNVIGNFTFRFEFMHYFMIVENEVTLVVSVPNQPLCRSKNLERAYQGFYFAVLIEHFPTHYQFLTANQLVSDHLFLSTKLQNIDSIYQLDSIQELEAFFCFGFKCVLWFESALQQT